MQKNKMPRGHIAHLDVYLKLEANLLYVINITYMYTSIANLEEQTLNFKISPYINIMPKILDEKQKISFIKKISKLKTTEKIWSKRLSILNIYLKVSGMFLNYPTGHEFWWILSTYGQLVLEENRIIYILHQKVAIRFFL